MSPLLLLILLASLPFAAKGITLWLGVTGYALQSLYKILQLLIPCAWRYREGKRRWQILWPTDEPLPSIATWIMAITIAVVFTGLASLLIPWFAARYGIDPSVVRAGFDERFTVSPRSAIAIVVFLSFLNSALEELHFRAWMDRTFSRLTSPWIGIPVSASAFGLMHTMIFAGALDVDPMVYVLMILGLSVIGVAWSLLMRRRGGIHAAWLSHGLTDALFLTWGLYWLGYL